MLLMSVPWSAHDQVFKIFIILKLNSQFSAHLCACGIAALLKRMKKEFVTVGVDGSVYRFHPTFKDLLDSKIDELVDGKHEVGNNFKGINKTNIFSSFWY